MKNAQTKVLLIVCALAMFVAAGAVAVYFPGWGDVVAIAVFGLIAFGMNEVNKK